MGISINSPIIINGSTVFGGRQQAPTGPTTVEYLVVAGGGGAGGGYNSGGGGATSFGTGGTGGSGVIIVRHSDSFAQAVTTGSPTITTSGGYIFTSLQVQEPYSGIKELK